MRIGITEYGDAGIDLRWNDKLNSKRVKVPFDGAILITKNINDKFIETVLSQEKPLIIHCTCTGYGGTVFEPNVPSYKVQLDNLKKLIDSGFPKERIVLRIDPLIPTEDCLLKTKEMIDYFNSLNLGVDRFRISVLDEYKFVKERLLKEGMNPFYGFYDFRASIPQFELVYKMLSSYDFIYETCAEDFLAKKHPDIFKINGCLSNKDLNLMGFESIKVGENPQNRPGCHCLNIKEELLIPRKECPHNCIYCFWRRNGE